MCQSSTRDTDRSCRSRYSKLFVVVSILALLSTSMPASAMSLEELMKKHVEALGGRAAIDGVKTSENEAAVSLAGMTGTAHAYYKAPNMYPSEIRLPIATIVQFTDGNGYWMQDLTGQTREMSGEEVQEVRTTVFMVSGEYTKPSHFGTEVKYAEETEIDGNRYHKLLIQPTNGLKNTVYIDAETYLISMIDATVQSINIRTTQSDYRDVDGIMVAYKSHQETGVAAMNADMTVTKQTFNEPISDTLFSPSSEIGAEDEYALTAPSTIEAKIRYGHIYVPVYVNGHGPYYFVLDSGAGLTAVSAELEKELGLPGTGELPAIGTGGVDIGRFVEIDSVRVGDVTVPDVVGGSLDLSSLNQVAQSRIDGILGYELFSRFIVSIDYENELVTLYPKGTEVLPEASDTIEIELEQNHPMITAVINDSITGRFRIDTGSANFLDLNSPIVKEYDLIGASSTAEGDIVLKGVGQTEYRSKLGKLGSFTIGKNRIRSVPTGFSTAETGIFSTESNDGNIGAGILSKFTCTFDYGDQLLYLTPNESFDETNDLASTGMSLRKDEDHVIVRHIMSGSSADRNGITVGDTILSISGQRLTNLELFEIHELLNGNTGDDVEVEVAGADGTRKLKLKVESPFGS